MSAHWVARAASAAHAPLRPERGARREGERLRRGVQGRPCWETGSAASGNCSVNTGTLCESDPVLRNHCGSSLHARGHRLWRLTGLRIQT